LFMAKGMIQQVDGVELAAYLDVPGFARGDLYYLQKLALLLDLGIDGYKVSYSPIVNQIEEGETAVFNFTVEKTGQFDQPVAVSISNPNSMLSVGSYAATVTPPASFELRFTDFHEPGELGDGGMIYPVTVTFSANDVVRQVKIYVLVNGEQILLPMIKP
jgi:hypothetical protein